MNNTESLYNQFIKDHPEFVNGVVKYRMVDDFLQVIIEDEEGRQDSIMYRPENKAADMVNHPPHYQSKNGLEAIDVIEAFTADLKGPEATNTGNVIKYILRWKGKNGLQDLQKARWYLERLINHVEKESEQ
jgi:hypothetical protein